MKLVKAVEPPAGFTRALFRLPIHLYRLRLGWLFGNRLLLLNHIGRVSGKTHQTVLEVAEHNAADDSYTVASGWGPTAAWYRNILHNPSQVRAAPIGPTPLLSNTSQQFPTIPTPLHNLPTVPNLSQTASTTYDYNNDTPKCVWHIGTSGAILIWWRAARAPKSQPSQLVSLAKVCEVVAGVDDLAAIALEHQLLQRHSPPSRARQPGSAAGQRGPWGSTTPRAIPGPRRG